MTNENNIDANKVYTQVGFPLYPNVDNVIITPYNEKDPQPNDNEPLSENENDNDDDDSDFDEDKNGIEEYDEEDTDLEFGLDVPGSELDDADEAIGNEDEENNYYSIGGDGHNNLEEDNN